MIVIGELVDVDLLTAALGDVLNSGVVRMYRSAVFHKIKKKNDC